MQTVTVRSLPMTRLSAFLRLRAGSSTAGLDTFMLLVGLVGLPLGVWSVVELLRTPLQIGLTNLAVLVVVLVGGELLPITIPRQGRESDEITISTTFAIALLLIAPIGLVVLAQALPMVLDDFRRRKHWTRPLFNVAHYTVAFFAARGAFCLLTGGGLFTPGAFAQQDLLPAFAAGLVFFGVNHACVSTAIALATHERVLDTLVADLRFQLSTSGLLVLLAPLVVVANDFSLALVPVLILPLIAVRVSAQLAIQREFDTLHDGLTSLPNRALFQLDIGRAVREAQVSGQGVVVVLADLDHFKEINDTLGHDVGDRLLVEVARRLIVAAGPEVVVARLGGDEFALLASFQGDADTCAAAAVDLAGRAVAGLKDPITVAGVRLDVQASLGIVLSPEHGTDVSQLMARADVAMYAAKADRGGWAIYDPELDENTPQRLALLAELRDGIGRDELVVHYQPKCETRSGEVVGAEALVRWQHPTRGLLMPDQFIPVAENTGLISPVTLVVLETAIRQARSWLDGGRRLEVAVNLSVRHLTDLELPRQVEASLLRHGLPPELLTLEVTESTIMNDPSRAVLVLDGLRELGVRIAVDDYGTGYSSLAYLKRLAVDELKIDMSFVMGMRSDDSDAVIVRSTIELGHNLGLQLVAEGVEDAETWQLLLPLGCDVLQGYHISRPLPADRFWSWLPEWDRRLALVGPAPWPQPPVRKPPLRERPAQAPPSVSAPRVGVEREVDPPC